MEHPAAAQDDGTEKKIQKDSAGGAVGALRQNSVGNAEHDGQRAERIGADAQTEQIPQPLQKNVKGEQGGKSEQKGGKISEKLRTQEGGNLRREFIPAQQQEIEQAEKQCQAETHRGTAKKTAIFLQERLQGGRGSLRLNSDRRAGFRFLSLCGLRGLLRLRAAFFRPVRRHLHGGVCFPLSAGGGFGRRGHGRFRSCGRLLSSGGRRRRTLRLCRGHRL